MAERKNSCGKTDGNNSFDTYRWKLPPDELHEGDIMIGRDACLRERMSPQRNANALIIGNDPDYMYRIISEMADTCSGSLFAEVPDGYFIGLAVEILEKRGYDVKIVDMSHFSGGNGYNPFRYTDTVEKAKVMSEWLAGQALDKPADDSDEYDLAVAELLETGIMHICFGSELQTLRSLRGLKRFLRSDEKVMLAAVQDDGADSPSAEAMRNFLTRNSDARRFAFDRVLDFMKEIPDGILPVTDTDEISLDRLAKGKRAVFVICRYLHTFLLRNLIVRQAYEETTAAYTPGQKNMTSFFLCDLEQLYDFELPGMMKRASGYGCRTFAKSRCPFWNDRLLRMEDRETFGAFGTVLYFDSDAEVFKVSDDRKAMMDFMYGRLKEDNGAFIYGKSLLMNIPEGKMVIDVSGKGACLCDMPGPESELCGIPAHEASEHAFSMKIRLPGRMESEALALLGIVHDKSSEPAAEIRKDGIPLETIKELQNLGHVLESVQDAPELHKFLAFAEDNCSFRFRVKVRTFQERDSKPEIMLCGIEGTAEDEEEMEEFSRTFYMADTYSLAGYACEAEFD